MGFGDYILLSGKLRELKRALPQVQFTARNLEGKFFFDQVFKGNPYLTKSKDFDPRRPWVELAQIQTGARHDVEGKIFWDVELNPIRGDLFFSDEEVNWAQKQLASILPPPSRTHSTAQKRAIGGKRTMTRVGIDLECEYSKLIFISPIATSSRILNGELVAYEHSKNKEWPIEHWESLIEHRRDDYFIFTGPPGYRKLAPRGSIFIETTFRQACAVLNLCDLFVGIEGGLHHAAAALRIPGVVIFGHWNSSEITGYGLHLNLQTRTRGFHGCGKLSHCTNCYEWLKNLKPKTVSEHIDSIVG